MSNPERMTIKITPPLWHALKVAMAVAPRRLHEQTRSFSSLLDEIATGNDELLDLVRKARKGSKY